MRIARPLNGPRKHFEYVLDDAENHGVVELSTPRGPIEVRYVEDPKHDSRYWLILITRDGKIIEASQDEELLIQTMNREGVSFIRG